MTAPVAQRPGGETPGRYMISFVMPSRYRLETLPEPTDSRIRLRAEPARLMAVRRYAGRWTEANYRDNEAKLLGPVAQAGLKPLGAPVYARYNSPCSLWFMRRNEAMIDVESGGQPLPP